MIQPRELEFLEPNDTFADRISKFSNLLKVATKLGLSQKLSVIFPKEFPQDCLRLIIQMSPDTRE